MVRNINPFTYARREYDEEHTIYISNDQEYLEWVSSQQYLFEGLRGSGKTSILRSMQWDVVWHTGKIRVEGSRRTKDIFAKAQQHLAVCHKVEEMDAAYWDSWKNQVGVEWAQKFYGTYIEYLLLDLFLDALIRIVQIEPDKFENPQSEKR